MKAVSLSCVMVIFVAGVLWFGLRQSDHSWHGVDEIVVERFAEQAGRHAQKPLINTDQGDLLLFAFLIAGALGGFLAGYYFRHLFPPQHHECEGRGEIV